VVGSGNGKAQPFRTASGGAAAPPGAANIFWGCNSPRLARRGLYDVAATRLQIATHI